MGISWLPMGISWLPIRNFLVTYGNFLVTYTEFLGYLYGISWLPIIEKTGMNKGFFTPCNQVGNQEPNQVCNQAIYQGKAAKGCMVLRT